MRWSMTFQGSQITWQSGRSLYVCFKCLHLRAIQARVDDVISFLHPTAVLSRKHRKKVPSCGSQGSFDKWDMASSVLRLFGKDYFWQMRSKTDISRHAMHVQIGKTTSPIYCQSMVTSKAHMTPSLYSSRRTNVCNNYIELIDLGQAILRWLAFNCLV